MPSVSVIVPVYNVEDYIEECLESLRAQRFADFEVLCVIDGSTDGSQAIAQRFADQDDRFRILIKENGGLSSARNHGLDHAQGDIVLFVDSDDYVTDDCVGRVVEAMETTGAEVLVFGAKLVPEEAATEWYDRVLSPEQGEFDSFSPEFIFNGHTSPFVWRNAVRRDTLERTGLRFDENLPFGEDLVFQFALYPRVQKAASIPDKLYRYRVDRAGSLMDRWRDFSVQLAAHIDMLEIILADWEQLGLLRQNADKLLDRSCELLLYGADQLPPAEQAEHYARVSEQWERYFDMPGLRPMQVKTECLCRGSGKLYVQCRVNALIPFAELSCRAFAEGRTVPAHAFPLDCNEGAAEQVWVLELPELGARSIEVVLSPDERSLEEASLTVRFARAKWASRLNYRLRSARCAAIRDIEQSFIDGRYRVEVKERFADGDDAIWRFAIDWKGSKEAVPDIAVLDARGLPLNFECCILESQTLEDAEEGSVNRLFGSIKLPGNHNHFIVIASKVDDGVLDGFAVVDPVGAQGRARATADFMKSASDDDAAYRTWFKRHRARTAELDRQREAAKGMLSLFGVVFVGDSSIAALRDATLRSLQAQTYERWRLVDAFELEAGALDGIDYLLFIPAGDTLEPNALYEFALALEGDGHNEGADLVYCDEDVMDAKGRFGQPSLKSQLNVSLLYCGNWVGECFAIRSKAFASLASCEEVSSPAVAYDCVLRSFESGMRFCSVPRVLHHARTCSFPGTPHAEMQRALTQHLGRRGVRATVEPCETGVGMRVRYELPALCPLVSIIIPSKDHVDLLSACIDSIVERSTYERFEIVVVENNSTQAETFAYYERIQNEDSRVRVITWPDEFNYSKIVNFGAAAAKGEYLLFLNNDTDVIEPSFIEEMLGCLQRPEVGVVGAKLLFGDGLVQHAGVAVGVWNAVVHVNQNRALSDGGYQDRACLPCDYTAVTGACQMVSKQMFDKVGGYDELFAVGFNDVDFCMRVGEAGYVVVSTPYAVLHHREFASRGREVQGEKMERWKRERDLFEQRWPEPFASGDPYTSGNLMRNNTYYRLSDE